MEWEESTGGLIVKIKTECTSEMNSLVFHIEIKKRCVLLTFPLCNYDGSRLKLYVAMIFRPQEACMLLDVHRTSTGLGTRGVMPA